MGARPLVGALELRPAGALALKTLFDSLFAGELLISSDGQTLAEAARETVTDIFGEDPEALSNSIFKRRLDKARKLLSAPRFHTLALRLLQNLGLSTEGLRTDTLRLRAVSPGLEAVEAAAPVFYAHRDTWYGNPKCQINVWVPLQDVDSGNSFRFYPEHFTTPIANDSANFDADSFRGFGRLDPAGGWCYPRALERPSGDVYDVCMKKGEALLFSASHLHQTLPNQSQRVRFSVDFRFFLEPHLQNGVGAPDPDNQSRGLLIQDYRACGS